MDMRYHGGLCCGVKHIHGFEHDIRDVSKCTVPAYVWSASAAIPNGLSQLYQPYQMPAETALERLDRLIQFFRDNQGEGLIEVCLIYNRRYGRKNTWGHVCYDGQNAWFPVLRERGFRRARTFVNGNTGNTIHVYHLVVKEEE